MDDNMIQCIYCETWYEVIFNRNEIYDRIEFCPFCGEEYSVEDLEEMTQFLEDEI